MLITTKSKRLFNKACRVIPGGVNSPVRAFKAVGGRPLFIERAKGSKVYDVDSNEFIDYVMSWGALILGHSHPAIQKALKAAIKKGTSFGASTKGEIELAKTITEAIPSIEMVRLVNSGTEACMSAIRLARAYTKKDKIIKFSGCYHGHVDSLLVKAGSGLMTFGTPNSLGVPKHLAKDTFVLPYNDIDSFVRLIRAKHREIACSIIEPVCGNMGVVLPKKGFLEGLRELTKRYNILLIFDEVITGFRFIYGGMQTIFGITPDLSCLGKIIGGGLPIGAYGGNKEIMERVSPLGAVYQAGTLSGNPLAVTAGVVTLKILSKKSNFYKRLEEKTRYLCLSLKEEASKVGVNCQINFLGSMFTIFFTNSEIFDYRTAKKADTSLYKKFFISMLKSGIYLAPSQFEANFISFSHKGEDIHKTIEAARASFS